MRAPLFFAVLVAVVSIGGVLADEPTTAEEYLKRGDEHLKARATDKAIVDYSKAIELNSGFAKAYRQRGTAYFYSNKSEEALADLNTAIRLDPKDAQAYGARAEYYTGFDIRKATADYDRMVEISPTAESYHKRASYHYVYSHDYGAAISDYTSLIKLEPGVAINYIDRGHMHIKNNDTEHAIEDFTAAIRLEPKSASHTADRAKIYLAVKKYDDAIADATTAIALSDGASYYHLVRGEAYRRKGEPERATTDFTAAVENDPSQAGRVYLHQSELLPDLLDGVSSVEIYVATTAIKSTPDDPVLHIRRAAVHQRFNHAESVRDYTTALRLAPDRAPALLVCRGAAYQTAGRYASAVADYREALQLAPQMKLAESLLNAAIGKMAEYKSSTTVESVRLDEEVFFVKTSVEKDTLPDGAKKTIKKKLTTRHEVTVADVRRMDVEVRAALKQKQEATSGSSSSTTTKETTTTEGGGSLGVTGFLSFSGRRAKSRESGDESGYSSTTLTGWESEFCTSIRTGMEKSRAISSSVETSDEVSIEPVGKGKDQPFLVIYRDKYRSGTAKLKINGVDDEVRFAFPVGKDLTWEYAEKPKSDEKK